MSAGLVLHVFCLTAVFSSFLTPRYSPGWWRHGPSKVYHGYERLISDWTRKIYSDISPIFP